MNVCVPARTPGAFRLRGFFMYGLKSDTTTPGGDLKQTRFTIGPLSGEYLQGQSGVRL